MLIEPSHKQYVQWCRELARQIASAFDPPAPDKPTVISHEQTVLYNRCLKPLVSQYESDDRPHVFGWEWVTEAISIHAYSEAATRFCFGGRSSIYFSGPREYETVPRKTELSVAHDEAELLIPWVAEVCAHTPPGKELYASQTYPDDVRAHKYGGDEPLHIAVMRDSYVWTVRGIAAQAPIDAARREAQAKRLRAQQA